MATFVLIEPDSFGQTFSDIVQKERFNDHTSPDDDGMGVNRFHHVRRPTRGIQIKDDTYATLQVRMSNGTAIELFDAAAASDTGKGPYNSNFLLQQITEQRSEKQQVILTFGEPYIFFFGEQPRTLNVTGVLLNTEDFNWRAEWWENYDRYLRGSACVRNDARVYLSWDDIVVEGYMFRAGAQESAADRNVVHFQFEMFLTNYQNISNIGEEGIYIGTDIELDPAALRTIDGSDVSMTAMVRQMNMYDQISRGEGSNSLLASLRQGRTQDLTNWLTEIDGQVVDTLAAAGQFISGRNLRVPRGYTGSQAYDAEAVQLNLASIPGAMGVVSEPSATANRRINMNVYQTLLKEDTKNVVQSFAAILGPSYLPYGENAGPGLPLSRNVDEFVARDNALNELTASVPTGNLYETQRKTAAEAGDHVAEIFRAYGVDVESSSDLNLFFRKMMFGVGSIGLGMNLADKGASGFRDVMNKIGSVF